MATTKYQFYMGLLFVVGVLAIALMRFGIDLQNSDVVLTNRSNEYINNYAGHVDESDIEDFSNTNVTELKKDDLLNEGNETGGTNIQDVLASINYYKGRVSKSVSFFKLVFNIPTFFVLSLGLPIAEFGIYINILGYVLVIALLIIFIKLVRGS